MSCQLLLRFRKHLLVLSWGGEELGMSEGIIINTGQQHKWEANHLKLSIYK